MDSIIAILLKHGANPKIQDTLGNSPLIAAVFAGNTAIVSHLLLHGGSDVNTANKDGMTALHWV